MPALTQNSYGKSDIRLTKVIRNHPRHDLLEFSIDIQLTGDFAASYVAGNNCNIIATDSMKNTVYIFAKESEFRSPEEFAILLAEHFLRTYPHVDSSSVAVRQSTWNRLQAADDQSNHAFVSGGAELHTATAIAARDQKTTVSGGITDLFILKTTDSAFKGFIRDRYCTLKDTDDRIFATSVTAAWNFTETKCDFVSTHQRIRAAILAVFATHKSRAVQETMYEMGKAALAAAAEISRITLRLPNKHRIPVNLQPFGLTNENEIFVWTDEPFGDIHATIDRE